MMHISRPGDSFEGTDVVQNYRYRPDYPKAVYETLLGLTHSRGSLLDLGCGPGKVTAALAPYFVSTTAVDASLAMLQQARSDVPLQDVHWIHGQAEEVTLPGGPFDLVVAAASIHWMDLSLLCPRLALQVADSHVLAVVDGDGADEPPWQEAWEDFLEYWIWELKGERYLPHGASSYTSRMTAYRDWMSVSGEMDCESDEIQQSIDDFIACQHSRDTFAPSRLGPKLRAFDEALADLLRPHATDGMLGYRIRTRLTWGQLR